jgi:hypothetical protein
MKRRKYRAHNDVDPLNVLHKRFQRVDQRQRFAHQLVHFPVTRDQWFSHKIPFRFQARESAVSAIFRSSSQAYHNALP